MPGLKQEGLATELGKDWNQKKVSLPAAKEEIEPALLEQMAKVLKVPSEAIMNFDEEAAINIISTTFNSHDNSTSIAYKSSFAFNPIDKVIELYERMLKDKNEFIEKLEKMMNERK